MGIHRVKAMFHSTALVPDYDLAVARMSALFGLRVLECSDNYEPAVARRGGMTWVGDGSIEIGHPLVADAAPDRFVRRTGGGMQGVGVWVEDFAATVEHLEAGGVRVPVRHPRGFGFSSPRDLEGLQFEWSEFTAEEDPRVGATLPPLTQPPVVAVTHQAFVGAVVEDPGRAARRLAGLLGTAVVYEDPGTDATSPHAAVSLGDCVLALYPLTDPDTAEALWGRRHDRPGICALGLRVDDLAAACAALAAVDVHTRWDSDAARFLDRSETGGIEVVLVDSLLPGDPRVTDRR